MCSRHILGADEQALNTSVIKRLSGLECW